MIIEKQIIEPKIQLVCNSKCFFKAINQLRIKEAYFFYNGFKRGIKQEINRRRIK